MANSMIRLSRREREMECAFEAHLPGPGTQPDADELEPLSRLIQKARKEGR